MGSRMSTTFCSNRPDSSASRYAECIRSRSGNTRSAKTIFLGPACCSRWSARCVPTNPPPPNSTHVRSSNMRCRLSAQNTQDGTLQRELLEDPCVEGHRCTRRPHLMLWCIEKVLKRGAQCGRVPAVHDG